MHKRRIRSWYFGLIGFVGNVVAAEPVVYPLVHVQLLTDESPRPDGSESEVTQKLRQQLAAFPQLRYQIHYVSWPKALAEVSKRSDALVYKMLRTPSRETRFQWLLAGERVRLHLYSLAGEPLRQHSLEQLQAIAGLLIACPAQSAHCEMLRQRGFRAEQILEVRLTEQTSVERLLLARRVQFIAVAEADIRRRMAQLGIAATDYLKGPQVAELQDYLAGGPSLDPAIKQLLTQTAAQSL